MAKEIETYLEHNDMGKSVLQIYGMQQKHFIAKCARLKNIREKAVGLAEAIKKYFSTSYY